MATALVSLAAGPALYLLAYVAGHKLPMPQPALLAPHDRYEVAIEVILLGRGDELILHHVVSFRISLTSM